MDIERGKNRFVAMEKEDNSGPLGGISVLSDNSERKKEVVGLEVPDSSRARVF